MSIWGRLWGKSDPQAIETKASQAAQVMVMTPGQPVWTPRDYGSFAREAYQKNVVAFQSVDRIARAVASVPWLVFQGENELTTHPLLKLIKRPNPLQSGSQYMHEKVGFFLLAGNGYEERFKVGQNVRELYQLRPDRMKVIPSVEGVPAAYQYEVGGRKRRWDVDPRTLDSDVRHLRTFNPIDDWYGLSAVEPGAYAIDQSNEAMAWLQGLLQNSARPSGAIVHAPKDGSKLGDDEFYRIKREVEENYSGSRNAGRPMLLEGGLDWKQMGLSPTDMGIIEAKFSAARDVALAFGVPPQMLGIPGDSTFANYEQARLAFWEETVMPLVQMFADDWNAWLAEPMGVELRPNFEEIPAIADKKHQLWDMADKSTDLTINERRAMKGYEPIPGGDVILVSSSQITLGMATEPLSAPDTGLPVDDVKALIYGPKAD